MDLPNWPYFCGERKIKFGLKNVYKFLEAIGNPHLKLPPVIHIAGTNGKGSTIAFLKAIFNEANYKTHVYTSPHLVEFNERIILADQNITDNKLNDISDYCRNNSQDIPLSFFEGTTCMALKAFSETKADIVLLETGMGGRLDATNIIKKPIATVITPISYDHQNFLGETLEEIAKEKGGIIKNKTPLIISKQNLEAKNALIKIAKENKAPIYCYENEYSIENEYYISKNLNIPLSDISLVGDHQKINTATAIATIENIKKGFNISKKNILDGIKKAYWPGRLQKINLDNQKLWLDGGHNVAAAENIVSEIKKWLLKGEKISVVIAMMEDKDYVNFIKQFVKINKDEVELIFTKIENNLYQNPATMRDYAISLGINSKVIDNANSFIFKQKENKTKIACGSLYFVGEILKIIKNAKR